jgi:baculoviral IAP repeat-containing protein 7/8
MSLLHRLNSYVNWPSEFIQSCAALANAGFHYSGQRDKVVCAFCTIEIEGWSELTLNPREEHRARSPNCPFVSLTSFQTTNTSPVETPTPNMIASNSTGIDIEARASIPSVDTLKVEINRLKTFHNWSLSSPVQPADLAAAGLFYSGLKDTVQCAFCDGQLFNWVPGDQAVSEHRHFFPSCPFIMGNDVGNVPLTGEICCNDVTLPEKPKENQRLIDVLTCKVCMDSEIDEVLIPCGHFVSCQICNSKLRLCPICRSPVKATFKAFLS